MTYIHPIAKQLAKERRAIGQSIHQLSERCGYSESFLSKVECGARHPSMAAMVTWAQSLGFDVVLQRRPE